MAGSLGEPGRMGMVAAMTALALEKFNSRITQDDP
jgi:hypothetical protein